ncbi:MAG: hypothetical protein IPL54_07355 [Chitinophagaceae bacterium]|nr:hypothetical protein [Chitinophagaceae bacterium]
MKKLSFFVIFIKITLLVSANSVTVLIVNKSKHSIYGYSSQVKNGSFFVNDNGKVSPDEVKPGATAKFQTSQALALCGTEGYVTYAVNFEGKKYFLHVRFDVPYWGDNEFFYNADPPFKIRHIVGGPGSNVTITYEVYGEVPPGKITPAPVDLPLTGIGWITGKIDWKFEIGTPKEDPENAFEMEVLAPTKFWPKSANNIADKSDGTYTDYKVVSKATVTFEKKKARDDMHVSLYPKSTTLNYTISNLPTGVPFQVKMKPVSGFWQTSGKTPPQPAQYPNSKWFVYTTEIKNDDGVINYSMQGAWMNYDGSFIGSDGHAQNTKLGDLKKVLVRNKIILKPDDFNNTEMLNKSKTLNTVNPVKKTYVNKQVIKQ